MDAYVGSRGRFQLQSVCAYATVVNNCSTIKRRHLDQEGQKSALDRQGDPDDALQDVEALHPVLPPSVPGLSQNSLYQTTTTTLVASVQSPTFSARAQDRPPSSFHRYSVKMIMEEKGNGHTYGSMTTLSEVIPNVTSRGCLWACVNDPKIIWASAADRYYFSVVWHIQLDFVDLLSPTTHPDSSPGKRRRTLNLFQQVPWKTVGNRSRRSHSPEKKKFKGVRFRSNRRTWVAEMKPPKNKNKVSFGDFYSQTEAARAVDAAFHHFGKPLNFVDTPQLLSMLPPSTALNEVAKLKFVKEQAKWLASIASTLPSLSRAAPRLASEPFETSEYSTIFTAVTSGFRSFSEITSSFSVGDTDEADDGVSQPDPVAGFMANEIEPMEASFTAADHGGAVYEYEEG